MKRILVLASGAVLLFGGLTGSTAEATLGSGTTPSAAVIGTLDGPTKAKQDGITLKAKGDVNVRTFTLTYAVGGYSGWHAHPGIVVATVVSGSVVQRAGCAQPRTWQAGQSFTEVGPHYVRNYYRDDSADAVPAVLAITQIYPADVPTTELREDRQPPRCRRS